jgi:hypothetical protein
VEKQIDGARPRRSGASTASPTGNARSRRSRTPTILTPPCRPREHHDADADDPDTWSHHAGDTVVPSPWRATLASPTEALEWSNGPRSALRVPPICSAVRAVDLYARLVNPKEIS